MLGVLIVTELREDQWRSTPTEAKPGVNIFRTIQHLALLLRVVTGGRGGGSGGGSVVVAAAAAAAAIALFQSSTTVVSTAGMS